VTVEHDVLAGSGSQLKFVAPRVTAPGVRRARTSLRETRTATPAVWMPALRSPAIIFSGFSRSTEQATARPGHWGFWMLTAWGELGYMYGTRSMNPWEAQRPERKVNMREELTG
jgi:hypothetical protein